MKLIALVFLLGSLAPTLVDRGLAVHERYMVGTLVSKHDGSAVISTPLGTYSFPVSAERFEDRDLGDMVVVGVYRGRLFGQKILSAD